MKTLCGLLVVLGLVSLVYASPVGVYINDDFPGTALDSLTWNSGATPPATVTVADSKVNVASTSWNDDAWVSSIAAVKPDAGQTVTLTCTGLASVQWSVGSRFGLSDDSGNSVIKLMLDDGSNTRLQIINAGTDNRYTLGNTNYFSGNYSINWSPGLVTVIRNGTTLFDSSVNAPSWSIPDVAMKVAINSYGNSPVILDAVKLEVVPEPLSLVLLGLGGLALVRKR